MYMPVYISADKAKNHKNSAEDYSAYYNRHRVQEAWASFGSRQQYDLFLVLRFAPGLSVTDQCAKDKFDEFDRRMMRACYGYRWSEIIPENGFPRFANLEPGMSTPHYHAYVALEARGTRSKEDTLKIYEEMVDPTWRKLVPGGSTWVEPATNVRNGTRYITKGVGLQNTARIIF